MSVWSDGMVDVMDACLETFGVAVTYTPAGGAPVEITGILDTARDEFETAASSLSVATLATTLDIRPTDLSAPPAPGDSVTVDGVAYQVDRVDPEGPGAARLILKR